MHDTVWRDVIVDADFDDVGGGVSSTMEFVLGRPADLPEIVGTGIEIRPVECVVWRDAEADV